jgi:hypothetical protein
METTTSHTNTLLELLGIPPFLCHKNYQSIPPSLSLTSPPCSPSTPPLPLLFLDLSLLPPQPQTSLPCSGSSESTPPLPSHLTANAPLNKPTKCLMFCSPLPKGEGIKQALAWNREQLLDLRRLWELRRQQCITNSLIPMAQPPLMISDSALGVENRTSTATGTPLSSQTLCSTSPLDSQCGPPFSPMAWRGLTSIVRKPQRWQVTSSTPSKTTKMPLRFCHPTTMAESLRTSSLRASGLKKPSLPKGWVYTPEEVRTEVKAKVADPDRYLTIDALLTCSKRKAPDTSDPLHQYPPALNTTCYASLSVVRLGRG